MSVDRAVIAPEHPPLRIERLFGPLEGARLFPAPRATRSSATTAHGHSLLVDRFEDFAARCLFLRSAPGDGCPLRLSLGGEHEMRACQSGGWLLLPADEERPAYWIPRLPTARRLDGQGRILAESPVSLSEFSASRGGVTAVLPVPHGTQVDITAWQFDPRGRAIVESLMTPSTLETQAYFLWGSHTTYARPADLYVHLLHGHLYENRFAWPHRRKICSENDAHALYVVLSGLQRATGRQLYGLLMRQIVLSVLDRQDGDGGWRHGEWCDDMEPHFRLVGSAIHLLLQALEEEGDSPGLREPLERSVAYIAQQRDTLGIGAWFLHDGLEKSAAGMAASPSPWIPSRVLGKAPTTTLVLNTHLDVTILLDRYQNVTGDGRYADLVRSARQASAYMLACRPAEWLYRLLFFAINLAVLPTERARHLALPLRALKRAGWRWLAPNLHRVKTRYPRFVMPGGYVDRAVSLKGWASSYHAINLMDLVRHQRRFPDAVVGRVISQAVAYAENTGLLERWREVPPERYALGFWAEALYHICSMDASPAPRAALARAVLTLEAEGMGLPPSLLGANSEAIPRAQQRPCPILTDAGLRIVNLCRAGTQELLLVNAGTRALPWASPSPWGQAELTWVDPDGAPIVAPFEIGAGSWVRGVGLDSQAIFPGMAGEPACRTGHLTHHPSEGPP
jgi:hypothetical protein